MLKLVSRFVLEVLPYALSALIAAIIVPGFLSAHFHAAQELVRGDHAAFGQPATSSLSLSAVERQVFAKQVVAK